MIVSFKLAEEKIVLTENDLKSIIVGDRVAEASDFEFSLNSFFGDIDSILYQPVYINGKQYIATDIEYHKSEEEEEWIVSGVVTGDYILDSSVAKEDYAYEPNEPGDNFLWRVIQDSTPPIKIDEKSVFIDIRFTEEYLPLDLKPPKRGDRISDWLIKQLKEMKYVYWFEDNTLVIGRKESTSPVKVFTNSITIEKKKGDYWDSFWYKNDPFLMFLKKDEQANKPYHDIRIANKPYHSAKDNAPDLAATLNRVFKLSEGSKFIIETFKTNSGEYVVLLRIRKESGGTGGWIDMEFNDLFEIPDMSDEQELMRIISKSGCEYEYDNGQYDEIIMTPFDIRHNTYYEWAIPGSWHVYFPPDEDWPADNMYWRRGLLLARGRTANLSTDRFQCPNGFQFFEGIGLMSPLFSNEKTTSMMEIDNSFYKTVNLLDRVAFGIERIAKPQICTEKVLTMEDGQVHYDIKLDDQI